ncbi:hypothetical protein B566_EDAN007377 [Ephemera danica]|nr:hypothetical protein B566_EDAN007377 [Ephemera danica]
MRTGMSTQVATSGAMFAQFSSPVEDECKNGVMTKSHSPPAWKEFYKAKGSSANQEERRKELLELQKKYLLFSAFLYLLHSFPRDGSIYYINIYFFQYRKHAKTLMHSEWMLEVPPDLEEKWYFVPCPAGKRCLVISQRGITRAYSASGKLLATFPSLLPGGSHIKSSTCASRYAVLDCVWSYHSSTYYVLDILAWGNQPFLQCETEFRFFWLQSQLAETPLTETSKHNKFKFQPLTFKPYSSQTIEEVMLGPPLFPEVMDGVLFYHREAHYTAGPSPLVVWLLPFMLPEVLGVSVSDVLSAQQPADYPGHLDFVQHFESQTRQARKQEYKQRKAASRSALMETSMESQSSDDVDVQE